MSDEARRAMRPIAQRMDRLRREIRGVARASQAAHRGVDLSEGPVDFYDEDGEVRLSIGELEDGTYGVIENNPVAPPTPTAPDVEERPGAIAVIYDGTFEDDNAPLDLAYFEIHASRVPDYEADDGTQIGTFTSPNGGTFMFPTFESQGVWYFSVQAVNRSGLESDKSAEVPAQALPFAEYQPTDGEPPSEVTTATMSPSGFDALTIRINPNPNPDFTQYRVYLGTTSTPTAVLAETASTIVATSVLPDGTKLQPGVTYYARVQAFDDDGDGPVGPTVSAKTRFIAPEDVDEDILVVNELYGRDGYFGTIDANKITGTELEAVLAILGGLNVGPNISVNPDSGVVVRTPLGDMVLPADGGNPQLVGEATMMGLTILGMLGLRGVNNEIAKGSALSLATGVTAPKTAPVISPVYPNKPIHNGFFNMGLARLNAVPNRWYRSESVGGVATLTGIQQTTTGFEFLLGQQFNLTNARPEITSAVGGVTIVGNSAYVLCTTDAIVPGTFRGEYWIYQFTWNTSTNAWGFTRRWQYDPTTSLGSYSPYMPVIGHRPSTNEITVTQCAASGALQITHYSLTGTYSSRIGANLSAGNQWAPARDMRVGFFTSGDMGAEHFIAVASGEATARVFNPANSMIASAAETFPLPATDITGMAYDDTVGLFRAAGAALAYELSPIRTNTVAAVMTYRKANGVSPNFAQYETPRSPRAITTTFPKRASLQLSTSAIPDDATDPNDPDSVSFYVALNTTADTNTVYRRQTPPPAGATSQRVTVVATGGNPPTVSGFPLSTPAVLRSDASDNDGALIQLYGSGSARLGPIGVTSGGLASLQSEKVTGLIPVGGVIALAGQVTTPPPGWIPCDGRSFSSVAYPALAAAVGDLWRTHVGTTYYVPDLMDRTLVGSGTTRPLGSTDAMAAGGRSPAHLHAVSIESSKVNHGGRTNSPTNGSANVVGHVDGSNAGSHGHNVNGNTVGGGFWAEFPHASLNMLIRAV